MYDTTTSHTNSTHYQPTTTVTLPESPSMDCSKYINSVGRDLTHFVNTCLDTHDVYELLNSFDSYWSHVPDRVQSSPVDLSVNINFDNDTSGIKRVLEELIIDLKENGYESDEYVVNDFHCRPNSNRINDTKNNQNNNWIEEIDLIDEIIQSSLYNNDNVK